MPERLGSRPISPIVRVIAGALGVGLLITGVLSCVSFAVPNLGILHTYVLGRWAFLGNGLLELFFGWLFTRAALSRVGHGDHPKV